MANLRNHGISFEEASTVWANPFVRDLDDLYHSQQEDRYRLIGYSDTATLLSVFYTHRGDNVRIISAREATANERRFYHS
ncbi:MAG: BrnT family toxin [Gemmatimonadaceae bacterium]|nr:BrnT family toxin [Gloeobacterales cyanobacterium ES-bin-141]